MEQKTELSEQKGDAYRYQIFNNQLFGNIRVFVMNGEAWFVAKDVCIALEIANVTVALQRIDDDERTKLNLERSANGGGGETNVVNEYGLYSLILASRKKEAKVFKRWITHEVIPSIRKTGGYIGAKEDDTPDVIMAKALQIANNTLAMQKDRISNLEGAVKLLEPDAKYTRETLTSKNTWNTNIIAKEFGMSAVTLNQHLKQLGIQYKQHGVWVLSSKYQNKDYTKTSTYKYLNQDGTVGTRIQMEWTEKGRRWLHELHGKSKF